MMRFIPQKRGLVTAVLLALVLAAAAFFLLIPIESMAEAYYDHLNVEDVREVALGNRAKQYTDKNLKEDILPMEETDAARLLRYLGDITYSEEAPCHGGIPYSYFVITFQDGSKIQVSMCRNYDNWTVCFYRGEYGDADRMCKFYSITDPEEQKVLEKAILFSKNMMLEYFGVYI